MHDGREPGVGVLRHRRTVALRTPRPSSRGHPGRRCHQCDDSAATLVTGRALIGGALVGRHDHARLLDVDHDFGVTTVEQPA
jgi:hypothetical protein